VKEGNYKGAGVVCINLYEIFSIDNPTKIRSRLVIDRAVGRGDGGIGGGWLRSAGFLLKISKYSKIDCGDGYTAPEVIELYTLKEPIIYLVCRLCFIIAV
jgi:hypothetical protein